MTLPASAQSLVSRGQSFVTAELLPGAPVSDGVRVIGLELDLEPHWKTYWRSPGEVGIPPKFDFSKSTNLDNVEVYWPRPELFESFGQRTVGYADKVVLPIAVTPKDPMAPVGLDLAMEVGVCHQVCVLEVAELARTIPADQSDRAGEVAAAMRSVPQPGAAQGMEQATCRISGAGRDRQFDAAITFDRPLSDPTVLIEGPEGAWFHQTETTAEGGQIDVSSTLTLLFDDVWVSRNGVRMTVLAGDVAADIQGCTAPAG
ncbi:MAG: protein-disulfide reductase DsbD domain-containing protein [Pseudomonadota bacterium]